MMLKFQVFFFSSTRGGRKQNYENNGGHTAHNIPQYDNNGGHTAYNGTQSFSSVNNISGKLDDPGQVASSRHAMNNAFVTKKSRDLHSGRVKGIGKENDGLHIYRRERRFNMKNKSQRLAVALPVQDCNLWHKRLGHPSTQPKDVIPPSVPLMFESYFFEKSGDDSDPDLLTTTEVLPIDSIQTKGLRETQVFLGIEILRSKSGVIPNQRKYLLELIYDIGLSGSKPVDTPLESNLRPTTLEYDQSIGLSEDKPLCDTPKQSHYEAATRVVRYLKGTIGQGVWLQAKAGETLTCWCDSDWAACPNTRRSSAEAEYRSMASAVADVTWLLGLFKELEVPLKLPKEVTVDSAKKLKWRWEISGDPYIIPFHWLNR
uniref:Reverse transcriptase Ty1/copia-type domain-containing protein n=1 Tax=Solanum lycopersicum TaxID=4081 RepID=A0A3Q7EZW2_SOLLC